jgi:hypothetical protein
VLGGVWAAAHHGADVIVVNHREGSIQPDDLDDVPRGRGSAQGMPDNELPESRDASPGTELQVNRAHAVSLRGEAARQVRDVIGRATRDGLRIVRGARPDGVYEIVVPEHLAKGLTDKTLRFATPGSGDASVQIVHAKGSGGKGFAGRGDLREVKTTALDVFGPAAWQALALATQQHYLAEISAKLEGIQAGVDEVLARLDDKVIAALKDISESAAQARQALEREGKLSPRRLADLRDDAKEARRVWFETAETAGRQLDDYRAGKLGAERVEQSLATLMHATRVLAQCSDTIVAVGYSTADELQEVVADERDRIYPAIPQLLELCETAAAISDEWQARNDAYEALRPKNRIARRLPLPVVRLHQDEQATGLIVRHRPRQQPLSDAAVERVRALAEGGSAAQRLVVEIAADGSVLVGPGTPALSSAE